MSDNSIIFCILLCSHSEKIKKNSNINDDHAITRDLVLL